MTAYYYSEPGTIPVHVLRPYDNHLSSCIHLRICWYSAQKYTSPDIQTRSKGSAPPVLFL